MCRAAFMLRADLVSALQDFAERPDIDSPYYLYMQQAAEHLSSVLRASGFATMGTAGVLGEGRQGQASQIWQVLHLERG